MLKFLTHKLRTHSLNEDPNQEKVRLPAEHGKEFADQTVTLFSVVVIIITVKVVELVVKKYFLAHSGIFTLILFQFYE